MLDAVRELLKSSFPQLQILAKESDRHAGIVILEGECESWEQLVLVGQSVAKVKGVVNVVSDMTVKGVVIPKKDYTPFIEAGKSIGVIDECDVVIVGLGITGCAIARELSKYDLKIIAVEMGEDVATAASKANNGGVHCAAAVKPGTLKAKLSVEGNAMYDKWAEDLNFTFERPGVMRIIDQFDPKYFEGIYRGWQIALLNHDLTPTLMDGESIRKLVPEVDKYGVKPVAGLYLPSQGKVHPYEVCVKLIENAAINGVKVLFNCTVGDVIVEKDSIQGVITEQGIIRTKYIIDAAGVYSDEIAAMAGDRFFTIHNRKGTIAIIDKNKEPMYHMLFGHYTPAAYAKKNVESKGGGMDFTPSRNILLGPSATEVPDKEDIETTKADLDYTMGRNENGFVTRGDIIRIFAGARPADFKEDFIVEKSPVIDGLLVAGAIQSPGVGSAPAVALRIENILKEDALNKGNPLVLKENWNPKLPPKVHFDALSKEEKDKLIQEREEYGHIICRCETITEGEILDAIHSPVVPTTIEAIKRRTRAGMGRCQGGFCQARVLEILARELGKDWVEINLKGRGSNVLKKQNRGGE